MSKAKAHTELAATAIEAWALQVLHEQKQIEGDDHDFPAYRGDCY